MSVPVKEPKRKRKIPEEYWVGQELDWEASTIPVKLCVELPFWIMVSNCGQKIEVNGHSFDVWILEDFIEQYKGTITDSRTTCVNFGPPNAQKSDTELMTRKCRTVLVISSDCNRDVLAAKKEEDPRRSGAATLFLIDFCRAHIQVVNKLIQQYRLATYDYFAYEISPWDVPVWWLN